MDNLLNMGFYILQGAIISIKIYVVTILLSIPLGMLCSMGKLSRFKFLQWILEAYTWIFRGTPLLLQLFFVYYGLPYLGIELSKEMAAYVTFVINYGAYFTEIFRAGIQSIDKGQYEAAKALGMNYRQTMKSIIIPQAIKVVLPPTGNEAVTLIKDTALCSVIALADILRNAKAMVSKYATIEGFIIAAILYLVMTFVIIRVFRYIEKRFAYYN
ncbi:amino acid ABC transporter permease [Sinanaerobacter chloroacetimidivorans]|uniref:Amino acid ABC transporter permease n=1 Tax=Sinanaerobacter chloroacetimidivorans TaxID=2818044 RepID=A0A8J7W0L2_9FIRM|nr:amino acid ABC transporter permease [Sinanaerobacter chloroacetimidivorans]MBR0596780.1 amino acid ABC transporter permease [Sinanaerobacter chloroacetimidivorans]